MIDHVTFELHEWPASPVVLEIRQGRLRWYRGWGSCDEANSDWEPLSPSQCEELKTVFGEVEVWNWKSGYENSAIQDGTTWRMVTGEAGKRITSEGVNAFPRGWEKVRAVLLGLIE